MAHGAADLTGDNFPSLGGAPPNRQKQADDFAEEPRNRSASRSCSLPVEINYFFSTLPPPKKKICLRIFYAV